MIYLDERIGSKDLYPYIRSYGIDVEVGHLDFGDACFAGRGVEPTPDSKGRLVPANWAIGVERKRLTDLVGSIREKRLSGLQLPGMLETYNRCYVVVEGLLRPGRHGEAETWVGKGWGPLYLGRSGIMYREIDNYLNSLEEHLPVEVKMSGSDIMTAAIIVNLYHYWQTPYQQHSSYRSIYAPPPTQGHKASLHRHTAVECMLAQLPGLDQKAVIVAQHFTKLSRVEEGGEGKVWEAIMDATKKDWLRIKGVGKETVEKIWKVLHGRE